VSRAQWRSVMDFDPSGIPGGDELPVTNVTYDQALAFCDTLNSREATVDGIPPGYRYSLPSESQWEYACRAGTRTPFACGLVLTADHGNFDRDPLKHAHFAVGPRRVRAGTANGVGLVNMHGNVAEWCLDRYHDGYGDAPVDGSAWLDGPSPWRVMRGGAFGSIDAYCRSASRTAVDPSVRSPFHGLRVVLTPRYGEGLVRFAP